MYPWLQALRAGDVASVVGGLGPRDLAKHLAWEGTWLLAHGLPRKLAALAGRRRVTFDPAILGEGFVAARRARRLGHTSTRDPGAFTQQERFHQGIADNWRTFLGNIGL